MQDTARIYGLQDEVCRVVFGERRCSFYLTGGTALQRFYREVRLSEDLDFFASDNPLFKEEYRLVRQALLEKGLRVREEVVSRDFIRLVIEETLKVDFVNDRVFRYGTSWVLPSGYRVDNLVNILTNKIGTIVDREEPKDIVDLVLVASLASFSWSEMLDIALKKQVFSVDAFLEKLVTFPLSLLEVVRFTDRTFAQEIGTLLPRVIADIGRGGANSLGKGKLDIFAYPPTTLT